MPNLDQLCRDVGWKRDRSHEPELVKGPIHSGKYPMAEMGSLEIYDDKKIEE